MAPLCRILDVARSGFYAWIHKPVSDRAIEDQRLLQLIRYSYQASGKIYGSPRVFLDLREVGEPCGKQQSGYHRRSLAETAMARFKRIIGPQLQAGNGNGKKSKPK